MKTKEEIKKNIDELLSLKNEGYATQSDYKKDKKKAVKRIEFLTPCLLYLDGNPREEFIVSCKEKVEARMVSIFEGFMPWCGSNNQVPQEKRLSTFEREMEFPKMRLQLKHLNYILS